jgi:AraC-like DNA-binding protein
VKTIAFRVGFESRSYFSRAFKAFAGLDPAGFRTNPVVHRLNRDSPTPGP